MILKENYLNNKFYNQFKTQKHFFLILKKTKKLVKRKKRLTMLNEERI